jgi:hypothetical protein
LGTWRNWTPPLGEQARDLRKHRQSPSCARPEPVGRPSGERDDGRERERVAGHRRADYDDAGDLCTAASSLSSAAGALGPVVISDSPEMGLGPRSKRSFVVEVVEDVAGQVGAG